METNEKIKMLSSLIENELNGGCLYGASNQMDFVVKSTRWHRTIQSEFFHFVREWIIFHAKMFEDESKRCRFYDGRNQHVGEFCYMLYRNGFIDIWSNDEELIKESSEEDSKRFFESNPYSCLKCERIKEMMNED